MLVSVRLGVRSLQQVKELGIVVDECSLMANSLGKVRFPRSRDDEGLVRWFVADDRMLPRDADTR